VSDLKTFFDKPVMPAQDAFGGDSITERGTDPNVDLAGENALTQQMWANPPVPGIDGQESANSVSGLPSQPNRFEPAAEPPPPPTLQDRRPGTIDER
jgi:hypothetical protein